MSSNWLPIVLCAHRGNCSRFKARLQNKNFVALAQKILARDQQSCLYCGFECDKYQVVVNINQNYQDNSPDNLATACEFCAQCFLLDGLGKDGKSGGHIIYLPDVSQADINHFCRALFCSMLRDAPYKGKLQTTYLSLKDRGKPVEKLFGKGASDAKLFGQSLLDTKIPEGGQIPTILSELRLLPIKQYFQPQIHHWKNSVFQNMPL